MSESSSHRRDDFKWFIDLPSRWEDNDAYGHINNVVDYSWFDTAVNRFLSTIIFSTMRTIARAA